MQRVPSNLPCEVVHLVSQTCSYPEVLPPTMSQLLEYLKVISGLLLPTNHVVNRALGRPLVSMEK